MNEQNKSKGTGAGIAVGVLLTLAIVVVFFSGLIDLPDGGLPRGGLRLPFGRGSSQAAVPAEEPATDYYYSEEQFRQVYPYEGYYPGVYKLQTLLDTGYVLEASYDSMSECSLFLGQDSGGSAQRFRLEENDDGSYTVRSVVTDLVFTFTGSLDDPTWSAVLLRPDEGADSQHWWLEDDGADGFRLCNVFSGRYLDVSNAHVEQGQPVGCFRRNDDYNAQRWILIEDQWG